MSEDKNKSVSLLFLFWSFLKLGSTAFGGFMALISMVQTNIVDRAKLMSSEDMLDGISLATILPGPVAVNVVAYVGFRLRGGLGALVCAFAVILPSFLLMVALTIAYLRWGEIPAVKGLFAGFIPAVTAIIINAGWNISRKAVNNVVTGLLALSAFIVLVGIGGFYSTLGIIIVAALIGFLFLRKQSAIPDSELVTAKKDQKFSYIGIIFVSLLLLLFLLSFMLPIPFIKDNLHTKVFSTFAGMSLMLFGGGFVFIPMIQEIVVGTYQWVSQSEFTTAVAMGQITPGPILISATFIGYKVLGFIGALLATIAIFTPSALLMLLSSQALLYLKNSTVIQASLIGIRAAVTGMIFAAAIIIAQTAELHWASIAIFTLSILALFRLHIDVAWIIPGAGLLGFLLY
jgi:chromate transporter